MAPGKILVCDDEEQIAKLLCGLLSRAGHEAHYVTSPTSALDRIRRERFDLLVTDLRMPEQSGLELIEAARETSPELEALLITAYASAESAVDALRRGVADYVMKPFTSAEVRDAVRKALEARASRLDRAREVEDLAHKAETASTNLERRAGDLSLLYELSREIAGESDRLGAGLDLLRRHLQADTVVLSDAQGVRGCSGKPASRVLLSLAARAARESAAVQISTEMGALLASPVGVGAVAASRPERFDDDDRRLLEIASHDLELAVENDLLRADRRRAYLAIVTTLIEAVEAKDQYLHGHSKRVAEMARRFAFDVGFPARELEILETGAKLHDIGKIGIPEEILQKPGRLTEEEFAVIQDHPTIGERILSPLDFLKEVRPIVRHHHERWDGRGYPDGLRSHEIPRPAALLAIVDSFDAMTSDRPYRKGLPIQKACEILKEGAGSQWDPELVSRFDPNAHAS